MDCQVQALDFGLFRKLRAKIEAMKREKELKSFRGREFVWDIVKILLN